MLGVEIIYKGALPKLKRRDFNEKKKETFEVVGKHWHREYRPKHFTHAGAREYQVYKPRAGERGNTRRSFKSSYTGRKLRMMGHSNPLEFTGEAKKLSQVLDLRITSRTLRILLPRKFNFKNPNSDIDMREEATEVSAREEREIGELAAEDLTGRLDTITRTEKVKI